MKNLALMAGLNTFNVIRYSGLLIFGTPCKEHQYCSFAEYAACCGPFICGAMLR